MEHTGKRLRICLIVVVLAAVAAGLIYWYGGGAAHLADGTVLVFGNQTGWDQICLM